MQPITDKVIAEVTRRIIAELDPEEIILFGSYAWGTPHKYSDIDLCVIVSDGIPGFNRIGVRALNALNDLMVDVDVLVKTRFDIETFKTVPFTHQKIVEEGKPLYGQGEARIAASLVEESQAWFNCCTKVSYRATRHSYLSLPAGAEKALKTSFCTIKILRHIT